MKKSKIIIISIIITLFTALGFTVAASYDSSEDPIISLSYLRDVFEPEIFDKLEERFDELKEELKQSVQDIIGDNEFDEEQSEPTVVSYGYEVIELTTGDALYAVSACDIMLRAGDATCVAPDESQGIANYTAGTEIYNGQNLTINHMCLIPRGDGRGVVAESESVFLMVRGDYTIVKK